MTKDCIFKCQINGKWYRVYECVHPGDMRRTYYLTYVGRRRYDHSTWGSLGAAIGSILGACDGDVISDLKYIWR